MKLRIGSAIAVLAACAANLVAQAPSTGNTAQAQQVQLSGRNPAAGSVTATQSAIPGTTTSVNTINPGLSVSGPFSGSVSGAGKPFSGKLSLKDAIDRGLEFNLGSKNLSITLQQSRGQSIVTRSALLPNLNGSLTEVVQQTDLAAAGFRIHIPIPGITIPSIVGPFNYFDLRARLSQTVADFAALNNYRSSVEAIHANEFLAQDAKDLVVLAVGGAYLQVEAAQARIDAERAQLQTARDLYDQTAQQRAVGLLAQVDVNRSQVQMLIHQQRVTSLENDLAKQKINLARMIGLPPNDRFELSDQISWADAPALNEEDAVRIALSKRPDIKAAEAQVRAAEKAKLAVRGSRMPSLAVAADYGVIGENPSNSHGTFSFEGSLRFPIWQGGRYEGDLEQANAAIDQRRAELEDIRSRVESEVRGAYLDLEAASSQVDVARKNLDVARETLALTRQRLEAGITDFVDVSQAQAAVASAELDVINSIFAHNLAKLNLARAQGAAGDSLPQYLKIQ
ncbi:MAG TPA: TolC family protein [Bryobacteraceae bacterium]|nr:TolC family protein [Bryobacteraceae bacterium]